MNEKARIWIQCIDIGFTLKPQILDKASIATKISQCKAKISPIDMACFQFSANEATTASNVEVGHSSFGIFLATPPYQKIPFEW